MKLEELKKKVEAHRLKHGAKGCYRTIELCHSLMSERIKELEEQLEEEYRHDLKLAQGSSIEMLHKDRRIKELECAISGITPWLSASLEKENYCDEYKRACDLMFKADNEKR